jgi:hypothetical protein
MKREDGCGYCESVEQATPKSPRTEAKYQSQLKELEAEAAAWEGLKAMYVSMYEKAGKVISAAKDTCEELMGHGLYAIATLKQALDGLEGVTGDSE